MNAQDQLIDDVALILLANQSPMPLGIKASLITHYLKRQESPISPEALVGMAENEEDGFSLLSDYTNRVGYQFHWGFITEEQRKAIPDSADETEREDYLHYEVITEKNLNEFQRADILDFPFREMYVKHPLASHRFVCDVGSDHQALLDFTAWGEAECAALRNFMADVFVPFILPDLDATVEKLLTLRKTDERLFHVKCAEWAMGVLGTGDLELLLSAYEIPVSSFVRITGLPEYLADYSARYPESVPNRYVIPTAAEIGRAIQNHVSRADNGHRGSCQAINDSAQISCKPDIGRTLGGDIKTYCGPIPVNLGSKAEKYTDRKGFRDDEPGYKFEGGCIVEDFSPANLACDPDEFWAKDNIMYTVILDNLLEALNLPKRLLKKHEFVLEAFFCEMYYKHPLQHATFGWEDPILEDGVISFMGQGKSEVIELRHWIFDVFVPKILPDMMATANHLVALRNANEAEFLVEFGKWLSENEETQLVFADSAGRPSALTH